MLTVFTSVKGVLGRGIVGRMTATGPLTRRERVRETTTVEIKRTARELLVREGPAALTLRAITREMGLTAPALYRYFDSHEEVVGAVCHDVLDELTQVLQAARDTVGTDDPVGRLMATCREFRRWALAHPREFQLTFASAVDARPPKSPGTGADLSFGAVFLEIFVEIWAHRRFAAPDEGHLPPDLVRQLRRFSAAVGDRLPPGVLLAYLSGWVRLYGAVTIEVFGHLEFARIDAGAMFEAMLADMSRQLTTPPRSTVGSAAR